MSNAVQVRREDRVAAHATGFGVGLIVFMVAWTVAARVTERIVARPTHAVAAMFFALAAGIVTTVWTGRRLDASIRREGAQARAG